MQCDTLSKITKKGLVPVSWKEVIIIPIRKPGKDPSKPENYKPIALTSHICKLMEQMVSERIMFSLEKRGLIAAYQSEKVEEAGAPSIQSVFLAEVFFDLEKAYELL